jgi:hypothetical protein
MAASPYGNHLAQVWQVGEGVSLFRLELGDSVIYNNRGYGLSEQPSSCGDGLGLIAGLERSPEIAIGFGTDASLIDTVALEHTYPVVFQSYGSSTNVRSSVVVGHWQLLVGT